MLQIICLRRRAFFSVMCLTFLACAIGIFTIPERATIRSSLEIGSADVDQKEEPLEPPEQVAQRIPAIYAPAALLAMAEKGTSPSILSALQYSRVDNIGRSVVVVSTVDPGIANETKEFQQTIADYIIKELAPRGRASSEAIATRIALATKASDNLQQQIEADSNEIDSISALTVDLRGQLEKQRANLAALYQRAGTTLPPDESATIEAQIRELNEKISNQTTLIGNMTLERSQLVRELATTRRQSEVQARAIADAKFEQKSLVETRLSLRPSLMPAATASHRLSLLFIALAISVLVAIGIVTLLHNADTRKA
jgi:hypothetical protein